MHTHPYSHLVRYKAWADRGLHAVVARNIDHLSPEDASIVLRLLDHIHVVDRIFQHHLQGLPHAYRAPRSEPPTDLRAFIAAAREVDEWYVRYVDALTAEEFEQPVRFVFTSGTPASMTRGEILLHVCTHGTYHRGNAGILLQKNGIAPNDDRVTDFLEAAA